MQNQKTDKIQHNLLLFKLVVAVLSNLSRRKNSFLRSLSFFFFFSCNTVCNNIINYLWNYNTLFHMKELKKSKTKKYNKTR